MKNLFLIAFISIGIIAKGQPPHKDYFIKGDSSLNYYLYKFIEAHLDLKKYDTACISSCSFLRFDIENGVLSNLVMTTQIPSFLETVLRNALLSTAGKWKKNKRQTYLLPVVYIFEQHCQPKDNSLEVIVWSLHELTKLQDKPHFPGSGNDAPLECIYLNPLFLKSGYE